MDSPYLNYFKLAARLVGEAVLCPPNVLEDQMH